MKERVPVAPEERAFNKPRILCLSDSGVLTQAVADVERAAGTRPTLALSFRQLRQEPRLAFRLPFRRFDVALAYLTDIGAPLYRDFILTYLFLMRAKRKALRDIHGRELQLDAREGLRALGHCLGDLAGLPLVYGFARWRARQLCGRRALWHVKSPPARQFAYLRANLWQDSKAGGSVAHTAGVLAGFKAARFAATYVGTSEFPPAVQLGYRTVVVPPRLRWMRNLPDLPFLVYGEIFVRRCRALFDADPPDFVYQRYSVLNCSGASLAHRLGCPFVMEYNGSEVWIARHWSTPNIFEGLADQIELANLRRADLVVVVSRALRDEVVGRGILAQRVLVNPNAVDPDRYHPGLDGGPLGCQGSNRNHGQRPDIDRSWRD